MHRSSIPYLAMALLLAGCGLIAPATTTTTTTQPPEATAPETTAPVRWEPDADSPCLSGDKPFAGDGVISAFGGANGDATQIAAISWTPYEGCEQIVVDLLTADGAPAGAIDPVGVDYRATEGVIRIKLPEAITQSAVADSRFEGDLIDRAFVVETATGRLAIDIHAVPGGTLSLRAYEDVSPSRVVVDVRPDDEASPTRGANVTPAVVLLSPHPGPTDTSLTLEGYAKGQRGELEIEILGVDGDLVVEQSHEINSSAGLWREFIIEIADLPRRELELVVRMAGEPGEVRVELDARSTEVPDPPEV